MLKTYIDGAVNPRTQQAAVGILIVEEGQQRQIGEPLAEFLDNHATELVALHRLLELLLEEHREEETVFCHSDSKMLVNAVHKRYSKSYDLYLQQVISLLDHFPNFYLKWVPEKENRGADQLARNALKKKK